MMHRSVWFALVCIVGLSGMLVARAQDEQFIYGGPQNVYTPGHTIPVQYITGEANTGPLVLTVYAVPLERAVTIAQRGMYSSATVKDFAGLRVFTTLTSTTHAKDQPQTRTVVVTALPIGYYGVVAQIGKASTAALVDISTLGIVENELGSSRSFFAVDLRTFNRHLGPTRIELRENGVRRVIDCDFTSVAVEKNAGTPSKTASANPVAIATTNDGSVQILALNQYGSAASETGFVQIDRPVYRPGDTVYVRSIVRTGTIGMYAIPTGTRRVSVSDPDGTIIYQHMEEISSFGTINAVVRLPQDAQTGNYNVQTGSLSSSFLVAAYKKPEYALDFAPDSPFVIGGDRASFTLHADYFFGRPASGLKLHYIAYKRQPYIFWDSPYPESFAQFSPIRGYGREKIAEGDFITDGNGNSTVALGTQKIDREQSVDVEAAGSDASGRTVLTSVSVRVVPASFSVSMSPAQWFAQQGQANVITIATQKYETNPQTGYSLPRANEPVSIAIVGSRWDEKKQKSVEISRVTEHVTTDANGNAKLSWVPNAAGSYVFTATATDERGNITQDSLYMWVAGSDESTYFAPIEDPVIIAQKQTYASGERPRLLITLPTTGRDILVVVATDHLISTRAMRVTGRTIALNVDEPKDASKFTVTAQLPTENGVSTATTTIAVSPAPRGLRVTITPHAKRYEPGQRAQFDVRAVDARGKPVVADLGIGVVDEAIYAVQEASTATPLDAFYGQISSVYPTYSWFRPNLSPRMEMSLAKSVGIPAPSGVGAPETPITIRSNFQDTAYWAPSVVTNAEGRATIAFIWPDNLTTWRATGVGVTRNTDVGQGTGKALVTKDFLVRLETPRFLRAGDTSEIIGIAQGQVTHPNVQVRLNAPGLLASAIPATQSLTLDANQSANATWPVVAPGVGSVMLQLSGSDGTLNDAMQSLLPLEAGTAPEHVRSAGTSIAGENMLTLAIPDRYVAGDVHLTLSPSIVAELVQNVRLLNVYPYYCTEQTISAALPAIFVEHILKRAHLSQPGDIDTGIIVNNAIARLDALQHDDGSWGWWEYDNAHPFMTAYAVYALSEFRKNGYPVSTSVFNRGVSSLLSQLATSNSDTLRFWGGEQPNSEWNTRAFMLYALSQAAPAQVPAALLESTRGHAGQLNPYALAVLGLAEHALHNDAAALDILAQLDARAIDDGTFTYWRGDTWDYAWENDPIETTAYALRLEFALNPQSPRVARIVNFLRAQRQGNWWYTTKDTAASIYALSEALTPDTSEFSPNEIVTVKIDGHTVRTLHITAPILDAADASVVIPASLVHDGSTIAFERNGTGALYWASDAVRYLPASATSSSDVSGGILTRLFAKPPAFSISRTYDVGHGGPWRVGDVVNVDLSVRSNGDAQYVAIEDPFPAGAEPQSEQGHADTDAWSGIQLLDDHAAFFSDSMSAGNEIHLRYTLRVTTPGTYTAPPPAAYSMYGPPVSSVGRAEIIQVAP